MESSVFAAVVTGEEWASIPQQVANKLEAFASEKFEELITCKALLETTRFNAEKTTQELSSKLDAFTKENETLKHRLDAATGTISELENQLSQITGEMAKLRNDCSKFASEAADFRQQRNAAVDERDERSLMLQRRDSEIERLRLEMDTMLKQLETAISEKCEALVRVDEVQSMKLSIESREKTLKQKEELMKSEIENLSQDLRERTEELLSMRSDKGSRWYQAETKLLEKTEELAVANDQIKRLTELNGNLSTRIEELSQKLLEQREADAKMNESYMQEVEAKTKLVNAYKSMFEEGQQHAEGLKDALAEVQQLLQHATEQYGELETKHKESELAHEEIIAKKNECIAMLKKELDNSREVLENSKHEQLQKDIEGLSPTASSASRLLKSGLTVTEIYGQYVSISERVVDVEKENAQLKNYISSIVQEIEEKGPLIKKLREDYSNTLDANEALKNANDQLLAEIQQLRDANGEFSRLEGIVARENVRYKKEVADLSRQVCHLLQEIENSRVGSSSNSTDMDLSDSVSSADIISKKLVTFNDIAELQKNNQKLLAVVRELTERQEEAESFDPAEIANLKMKLESMRESQSELLEERERQNKMMMTLSNQRDMFKNLYAQAVKAAGEEMSSNILDASVINGVPDKSTMTQDGDSQPQRNDDKLTELTNQIDGLKKTIAHLKEEHETYRKERGEHEKLLTEQIERMRKESNDLVVANCRLQAQVENNEERFKVAQNNIEIYKKQISALEKQNRIYSETIVKHEQAINYMKDETMQAQTKATKAEVRLGTLQEENALLKGHETRLRHERDLLQREITSLNTIQKTVELIKATVERTDAESKLRLEECLGEAVRQSSVSSKKLEEEQLRFKELSQYLENQTKVAKERYEEERLAGEKLRKELAEAREELVQKSAQVEDLSKKLKNSILAMPDSNPDLQRIQQLMQEVNDSKAEIEALQMKLKTTKEASEQYFNVASESEGQLKIVLEQKAEIELQLQAEQERAKQLEEKCAELESELSIHMDDQDMANASVTSKSHKLQEELSTTTMDLETARKELENARNENRMLNESVKAVENKYAREVMLHSNDLQQLTDMKADLDRLQNEVNALNKERECALDELTQNRASWEEQQSIIKRERDELEERYREVNVQYNLLLDEIQALNTKLSVIQAQTNANTSSSAETMNRSFFEDDVESPERLRTMITFIRNEKDIAVAKAEIFQSENKLLTSENQMLTKQLNETKESMEITRQGSEISAITSAKHRELLNKVEMLNSITDSNRALRQERDALNAQLSELRTQFDRLSKEFTPIQERNRELNIKTEALQSQNASLQGELDRWRQQANRLIETSHGKRPEDWKKLQGERETLAKQLTIERGNVAKLADEVNHLKQDKSRLEDVVKQLKAQNHAQAEDIDKLKRDVTALQAQLQQLNQDVEQTRDRCKRFEEENRLLTEDTAGKDVKITELKTSLIQVRKIAKKYKVQFEDQLKSNEEESKKREQEQGSSERQIQEQRSELEDRIVQIEQSHKETLDKSTQQTATLIAENESYKKEIETLKHTSQEKEDKFKMLFKNAKERIMTLTEKNNILTMQLSNQQDNRSGETGEIEPSASGASTNANAELEARIEALEAEKSAIENERRQESEKYAADIEGLMLKVRQLQRQLGQQGSKPSTSSGPSEKPASEPPTANIKPMAGHSTNIQTQGVQMHSWRSASETPLASIRPMSAQLRTVTVAPTTQSPSAVMVPPQQQVHTTGGSSSSTVEAMSSSPTSSHTDYVPATSSASSAMSSGPRQVAVPPTQSSQDAGDDEEEEEEDDDVDDDDDEEVEGSGVPVQQPSTAQQQQAVALVLPRIEPPTIQSSHHAGPTQEQGTSSSSSSNAVTTSQTSSGGTKRQRDSSDTEHGDGDGKLMQQQTKRSRGIPHVQHSTTGTVSSDGGLEVEYQVPTSSQRDHDDDNVIVVESDEEGAEADEGEGADDDEPDDADAEAYDMEGMEQDNYEDPDCQDEDEEEGGNEVEVIEDSNEVPNQSEPSTMQEVISQEESVELAQPEATSSGTDGGADGVTLSQASTSVAMTMPSFSRTRPVAPLPSRQSAPQSHLLGMEEGGDDGIVPSTPTLFVPRRSDGFGEAVSSPAHVPTSGRFTFNESSMPPASTATAAASASGSSAEAALAGSSEVVPEQTLEVANMDENSTGRSVPSTPLQTSPQEAIPGNDEQGSSHMTQSEADIPTITVSVADDDDDDQSMADGGASSMECSTMAPPAASSDTHHHHQMASQQQQQPEESGYDGVTSEGEKQPTTTSTSSTAAESVEEGREAEASPSTNTRSRTTRGSGGTARRSVRQMARGSAGMTRASGPPTPIVWTEQRHNMPEYATMQRMSDGSGGGRGGRPNVQQPNYNSARVARRARGRGAQRPYGRY